MKRKAITDEIKDKVGRSCANCGATDDLQYHHIVPLAIGGNDIVSNMVCLCARCHWVIHQGAKPTFDHGECVKAGIKAAKERGVKWGKKPKDREKIVRVIAENSTMFNAFSELTEREVMEKAGVQAELYYECRRDLLMALKSKTWPYSFEKPEIVFNGAIDARVLKRNRGW